MNDAIESIDFTGTQTEALTDISQMFSSCDNLKSLDLSSWNTSNLTNLSYAFNSCVSLESLNVSGWDTSKVTSFDRLFNDCYSLKTLDLSSWSAKGFNGKYIGGMMFSGCGALETLDISGFDGKDMQFGSSSIFSQCYSLTNLTVGPNWGYNDTILNYTSGPTTLTSESVWDTINKLADKTGKTQSTLKLGIGLKKTFTTEEITAFTSACAAKNWILQFSSI